MLELTVKEVYDLVNSIQDCNTSIYNDLANINDSINNIRGAIGGDNQASSVLSQISKKFDGTSEKFEDNEKTPKSFRLRNYIFIVFLNYTSSFFFMVVLFLENSNSSRIFV